MARPVLPGSPVIQVSEDIVPIARFKAHLSEVVRGLRHRRRPVVVTQNGEPAAVVLSPEEFDRLSYHARLATAVEEGLADAAAGRVVSDAELERIVDRRYGAAAKPRRR